MTLNPALHKSTGIDLAENKLKRTDFRNSSNPPILHRKENMVLASHPNYGDFCQITQEGVEVGLYAGGFVLCLPLSNLPFLVLLKAKADKLQNKPCEQKRNILYGYCCAEHKVIFTNTEPRLIATGEGFNRVSSPIF